ncbi:MAG: DegT/DnrJ/EryC1/StrS family aminotransferase [Actinomycetota bacterium]
MSYKIPVAVPSLIGNEKKYVEDCMESGWISSAGKYVELFEKGFAEFCGVKQAVACCNGTVALHLALVALGVEPGDEVIVPTLTFVATPNAVTYCGAKPVFVDSEMETWNLDPAQVEAKITSRTKGIIAVHLYGHPAQMKKLKEIAARHKLFLLEDAAEAHGAVCDGQTVGSIGDIAAFSFYANKIITTGEGGMIVTNNGALADKVRLLRGQGMDPNRRYWHPIIGYNYRMMNLAAAIGLAQLEKINEQLAVRVKIAKAYRERLLKLPGIIPQPEQSWAYHAHWMFSIVLKPDLWPSRDKVIEELSKQGVETRPVFYPAHTFPPYLKFSGGETFPVAESLSAGGISLPTWTGLTEDEIDYVCRALEECRK